MAKKRGMVQIFTGDGKGKTTAALGAVMRALGHGLKVYVIFFMKGDYPYGEFETLRRLNVGMSSFGFNELTDPANIKPREIEQSRLALAAARKVISGGEYDLVILDEVNVALAWKLIELEEVVSLIRDKPEFVELILTGRYADPRLLEMADLITDMTCIKHPYTGGVLARKGIEY